jgi:1-acyl-sn-glycerol-3-phosphate acyltransferase
MKHYRWRSLLFWLLRTLTGPVIKLVMGYSCGRQKGPYAPSIIIANHNTDMDPILVALGFSRHMFFLASEHAFRAGFWSKVLMFACAPIPIDKTRADNAAVKEMLRRLKAGCNICLFAEGNRSYNGVTGPIPPATAKLVKISGAALITYRLEGGYFTTPRWAKNKRRGKMAGRVVGRYFADELRAMSNGQVLSVIERDIYENAYERQAKRPVIYRGRDLAEHIETALYLCPACHSIGTIRSKGDSFFCACGLKARYTKTGLLEGESLPFSTITAWDSWQAKHLAFIVKRGGEGPLCADEDQQLFTVKPARGSMLAGRGPMRLSRQALQCAGLAFPLQDINRLAVAGQMTLLLSLKDGTNYEIRSAVPRSAVKYLEILRILRG